MNKQERLAELHIIRTTLDKVAKDYCTTPEERKTVKNISMRLFQTQILPLAEELTADLVKDTKKVVAENIPTGVQLIDLGLPSGTLWTDRNLGADAPEKTGDYFRFGETVPFTEKSPEYQYEEFKGDIAGTERDAATAILGEKFRTPTSEQIKELIGHCKMKWTTANGVMGMRVAGPNGNSIFFPAAGYRYASSAALAYVGSYGNYWSASPGSTHYGRYLNLSDDHWSWDNSYRSCGYSVRPVAKK